MLTGNHDRGGIWMSVSPVTIKDGLVSRVLFQGKKHLLEGAARLNRKRLAAVFESVKADYGAKRGIVWEMIQAQSKPADEMSPGQRAIIEAAVRLGPPPVKLTPATN
jgi:hypothetical protein